MVFGVDFKKRLLVSVDADESIGAGHLMRCLAIAEASLDRGMEIVFVVSNEYAEGIVARRGFRAHVLPRNMIRYDANGGTNLARVSMREMADVILIDSYAVCEPFFLAMREESGGTPVFYVDDLYSFSSGRFADPRKWPVEGVVNYGFGFERSDYVDSYGEDTTLLIGPAYAPIGKTFLRTEFAVRDSVDRVLITSGSTNPNNALEIMSRAASSVFPRARLQIVVGPKAVIDKTAIPLSQCEVVCDVKDIASLMERADLAISAAGTTLYELCALGVPTLAVPVVENQLINAKGFQELGLGLAIEGLSAGEEAIEETLRLFLDDSRNRLRYSKVMRQTVTGKGAESIAAALYAGCR